MAVFILDQIFFFKDRIFRIIVTLWQKILIRMKRLLFAVLLFCSVSGFSQQKDPVEEWMEKLSVREKVAQLFIFEIYPNPDDERRAFEDSLACVYGVGGIIVMDGSVYDLVHRMKYLSSTSKVPQLFTIDAEWGAAMRFEEYLKYPKQEKLGKLPNAEKYVYKMGRNIGRELRDLGFAVNFAPVVDISPDNDWAQQRLPHRLPVPSSSAEAQARA